MKNYITAAIVALGLIISTAFLANAFKNRNRADDTISVTGLGSKDFVSDLIVWNSSFSKKSFELKEAYASLETDRNAIKNYLLSKGVKENELIFSSVSISKEFATTYDENSNVRSQTFNGYSLTQSVQIESKDVEKIENVSRSVSELINSGVELYSNTPEYYYTKLAALKLEMIAEATKDARLRAEKIAKNAGSSLGDLKKSDMGVFQIVAQNSSEEYSWGGSFNTAAKNKTATITMKLVYKID
ncbi:SIMPL domain-containing protein [Flavobacterium sp. xlx-214]|uniref:SIMPL domain-containing protein n=1 Tax=unclassified Flavobacterium TaxID=196869 RepID=UPI0013D091B1|nr:MULTISPECIES: SIMPL domain-containing protein [unclassified Flavobacterium]MBA5792241.1 SIMPL domain-containing protein [Flavobacterium sp. xlx-221]QMI82442.1 SIMPL domain-containing protein [Flavobacterium sp. xlx-214]